jgi:hypothetical protein
MFVNKKIFLLVGLTYCTSDNMGDLHILVINDISQMISRKTIGLENYRIDQPRAFLPDTSVDKIPECWIEIRNFESNHVIITICGPIFRLLWL